MDDGDGAGAESGSGSGAAGDDDAFLLSDVAPPRPTVDTGRVKELVQQIGGTVIPRAQKKLGKALKEAAKRKGEREAR